MAERAIAWYYKMASGETGTLVKPSGATRDEMHDHLAGKFFTDVETLHPLNTKNPRKVPAAVKALQAELRAEQELTDG